MGRNEKLADEDAARVKLLEIIKAHIDVYPGAPRNEALNNQFNIEDVNALPGLPLSELEQVAEWVEETYSDELEAVETETIL